MSVHAYDSSYCDMHAQSFYNPFHSIPCGTTLIGHVPSGTTWLACDQVAWLVQLLQRFLHATHYSNLLAIQASVHLLSHLYHELNLDDKMLGIEEKAIAIII